MTPRSRLYFRFKKAFKVIGSEKGKPYLESLGVFPIRFDVTKNGMPAPSEQGYFLDKKGNIVGTTVRPAAERHVYLPIRNTEPVAYRVEFKLGSAFDEYLKEIT
jgi:hypothetical protein